MAKIIRSKKTKEEALKYLEIFLNKYANDERVLKLKDSPHHGNINAYTHSLLVVHKAVDIVNFFHRKVNWEDLLLGALLHDFYLYDFHTTSSFKNSYIHPIKAAENAKKMFDANDHVLKIIRSHMFPVNFWRVPTSREAQIVSLAD